MRGAGARRSAGESDKHMFIKTCHPRFQPPHAELSARPDQERESQRRGSDPVRKGKKLAENEFRWDANPWTSDTHVGDSTRHLGVENL